MRRSDLEILVYPDPVPTGLAMSRLPGVYLERFLDVNIDDPARYKFLDSKLQHCCRKLVLMCLASERAEEAEREFYNETIKEAPALFGRHAAEIAYHLEAFIFFARSSLDVASALFSDLLFQKRTDSFNELTKKLLNRSDYAGALSDLSLLREREDSWFSILCGTTRGRALRDKVAHQTGFPIDYEELTLESEKERAVVRLSNQVSKPLDVFLSEVRSGVIQNFLYFESAVESGTVSVT